MPVYKRGRNRYEVRIHVRGQPKYKTVHGTRDDALAFEARWRMEIRSKAPPDEYRVAPTLSDFCVTRYKPYAALELKQRTWTNRQYQLATLMEHFGHRRLDKITLADIDAYRARRREAKISPTTINDDMKVLRTIVNYAIELKVPAALPRFRDLAARRKKGRATAWDTEQVAALYTAVQSKSPAVLGLVTVLINCGLRKGEAIALEWSQVDLERRLLRIWPSEEWQPKDGEPREVPIGRAVMPWLTGERAHGRYMFPSARGDRFAFWPQRAFDRARKAAGLTGGPHTCRHTFASHFLARCPDMWLLAQIMGHSYAKVTELYSHLLPEHLERARDVVDLAPALVEIPAPADHDPTTIGHGRRGKTGKSGK